MRNSIILAHFVHCLARAASARALALAASLLSTMVAGADVDASGLGRTLIVGCGVAAAPVYLSRRRAAACVVVVVAVVSGGAGAVLLLGPGSCVAAAHGSGARCGVWARASAVLCWWRGWCEVRDFVWQRLLCVLCGVWPHLRRLGGGGRVACGRRAGLGAHGVGALQLRGDGVTLVGVWLYEHALAAYTGGCCVLT